MRPFERPTPGDEPRRVPIEPPLFLRTVARFDGPQGMAANVEVVWSTNRRFQGLIAFGQLPRDGWFVVPLGPFQVAIRLVAPQAESVLEARDARIAAVERSLAPSLN